MGRYFGPACPSCPPLVGVDAPARTEGHYVAPQYVAPQLAGGYALPRYVAPDLAGLHGYGGAAGLGDSTKKDSLKLAKIVAKLESKQALTTAERDYVVNTRPIPVPRAAAKTSGTAKVMRDLGGVMRKTAVLAFWGTNLDFIANLIEAAETGKEIDWSAFSNQALIDAENVCKILVPILTLSAATVVLAPLAAFAPVAGALAVVINMARTGRTPTVNDMTTLSSAAAQIPDDRVREVSAKLKDPGVQATVQMAAQSVPASKSAPRLKSARVPTVAAVEQFNNLLARAKSLLASGGSTKIGRAGMPGVRLPGGFGMPGAARLPGRLPAQGAGRAGAAQARSTSGGSTIMPLLVFGGAAVLAVALLKKRK